MFVTKKRRRTYTMTERKSSRKTLTPKRFIPEETEKKDKDASGGQKSGGSKARLISSRSLRGCFFFCARKIRNICSRSGEEDSGKNRASSRALSRSRFSLRAFVGSAAFERSAFVFVRRTSHAHLFCTFLAH